MILNKVNKTIGLLRKLHNILPRSALLNVYKIFVRPHLDYGNIIYDQAYYADFHQKMELIQYNACLALTITTRGTSKEKFLFSTVVYTENYLIFINSTKIKFPQYLFKLISGKSSEYSTRYMQNVPFFKTKHSFF